MTSAACSARGTERGLELLYDNSHPVNRIPHPHPPSLDKPVRVPARIPVRVPMRIGQRLQRKLPLRTNWAILFTHARVVLPPEPLPVVTRGTVPTPTPAVITFSAQRLSGLNRRKPAICLASPFKIQDCRPSRELLGLGASLCLVV